MAKSIIGSNAALRYLKAYDKHITYWEEVNPAYQLAFVDKPEHVPYIREYAAALPNTMIVARIHHKLDGGLHLAPTGTNPDGTPDTRHSVSSPSEYLAAYGDLGMMDNIILNVMNEPNANGTPDEMMRLVTWFVDYIPLAASLKCKSVLFNWADKNPRIVDGMFDPQFDNVLRLMAAHPDLFFMGMHFYGPDAIHETLDAYVARCTFLGIKPSIVLGTEFGIDSIGGTNRGYKTWPNYKDIYGQWMGVQVKPPANPTFPTLSRHIASGVLGGLMIFQEGNSGGQDDFDFENNKGVKDEIKRAALAGEISVPDVPPPSPPPLPPPLLPPPYKPEPIIVGARYQVTTPLDHINIHLTPAVDGVAVGQLPNQSVITALEETLVGGDYWRKVTFGALTGWISMQKGAVKFAPYLGDGPSTVVVSIDLLKDVYNSLGNLQAQVAADRAMVKAILDKVGITP